MQWILLPLSAQIWKKKKYYSSSLARGIIAVAGGVAYSRQRILAYATHHVWSCVSERVSEMMF